MKKIITIAVCLFIVASVVFVSCEKDGNDVTPPSVTTTTCKDSAWLIADSLVCSGKNFFQVYGSNKLIAVPMGTPAIDSITGNAFFYITFDSIAGSTPCRGAVYQNATLSCFKRK